MSHCGAISGFERRMISQSDGFEPKTLQSKNWCRFWIFCLLTKCTAPLLFLICELDAILGASEEG